MINIQKEDRGNIQQFRLEAFILSNIPSLPSPLSLFPLLPPPPTPSPSVFTLLLLLFTILLHKYCFYLPKSFYFPFILLKSPYILSSLQPQTPSNILLLKSPYILSSLQPQTPSNILFQLINYTLRFQNISHLLGTLHFLIYDYVNLKLTLILNIFGPQDFQCGLGRGVISPPPPLRSQFLLVTGS